MRPIEWRGPLRNRAVRDRRSSATACTRRDRSLRVEHLEARRLLAVQPFPTPLDPISPEVGQIFSGTVGGTLPNSGTTESYQIEVGSNQKLTVIVDPASELGVEVDVLDPSVASVATAAPPVGTDAVVQTLTTEPGVYQIDVSAAPGSSGNFDVHIVVNAAVEVESHDGVDNGVFTAPQDLDGAFIEVAPGQQRGAVDATLAVGDADIDWYRFTLNDGEAASFVVDAAAAPGMPTLELYAADGATLIAKSVAAGDSQQRIDEFVDDTSDSIADEYLVRIAGAEADYRLLVAKQITFEREPNDAIQSAEDISLLGAVVGYADAGVEDYFEIQANADDVLQIDVTALVGTVAAASNLLDPEITFFDPDGTEVPHVNVVGDETLEHTALLSGAYAIRVAAASDPGVYRLQVSGQTGTRPPFSAAAVDLSDGAFLPASPGTVAFDLNDLANAASVEAADLLIDGEPLATQVELSDGDAMVFTLPELAEGLHTLQLPAGSIHDLDGQSLEQLDIQFTVDLTAPQVVSSSLLEGDVVDAGSLTYTAVFSEALLESNLDEDDLSLVGETSGSHTPSSLTYDPESFTLTVQYDGLPEDGYTLTLLAGDGRLEDLAGNDLDGEPHPDDSIPSGDGTAGGDFSVQFSTDQLAPVVLAPVRAAPLGSLVSISRSNVGLINQASDADAFQFFAQAGSYFTVSVTPEDPSALLTLQVLDKTFALVAPAPGAPVVLPPLAVTDTELVDLRIKGDRSTSFLMDVVLNSALETADTTGENPLALPSLDITAGAALPAVVGAASPTTEQVGVLTAEGNDTLAAAVISGIGFGRNHYTSSGVLGDNPDLADPALDVDFVSMELAAGDQLVVDLDASAIGSPLDAVLSLFNADGELVAQNDDSTSVDPLLNYVAEKPGYYYLGVSGFANLAYDPFVAGSGLQGSLGSYELDVALNGGGDVSGGTVTVPDVDFYTVDWTTLGGASVDIVLAGQLEIDQSAGLLELIDTDGETVLATADAQPSGVDAENFDLAILDFVVPQPGVYTLRFRSTTAGLYTLTAADGLIFETEPNGQLSDPLRTLSSSFEAIGYLGVEHAVESASSADGYLAASPDPGAGGGFTNLIVEQESEPNETFDEAMFLPLGFGDGQDASVDVQGILSHSSDVDYYRVDLQPGDVLGLSVDDAGRALSLRDAADLELVGTETNISFVYPDTSPLPRTGNAALARVIDAPGSYYIRTSGIQGNYTLYLRVFRPAMESEAFGTRQTLFIDFDGASVDPTLFGASGSGNLSPLENFLPGWGLTVDDQDAVIDAIMAHVTENLLTDVIAAGANGNFDASGVPGEFGIEILNSRDHPDPFGQPNVSRVVVGGSSDELLTTIGIAEFIDIGNLETTGTAVVLLDFLSGPGGVNSLNQYELAPTSSIIDLVGAGVGNITAHEALHLFGGFHTDRLNGLPTIADEGGNLNNFVGLVGSVWGDGDEVDVDLIADAYSANEVFTGVQNSLNLYSYGLSTGTVGGPLSGPRVVAVDPPAGFVHDQVSSIVVDFNEPLDPVAAEDPTNYVLLGAGPNGQFEDGAADDIVIGVTPVYDGLQSVELQIDPAAAPLAVGHYRLSLLASLQDVDGNPLNSVEGPGGGSDFQLDWEVVEIDPNADIYQVSLSVGERVIVGTTTPFDDPNSPQLNDLDAELFVYDPSGAPIAFDVGSRDGKNPQLQFNPAQDGDYAIVVLPEAGGGEYILDVEVSLIGNYNEDAFVNGRDFLAWQRTYGSSVDPTGSGADGDQNGAIDQGDLLVWQSYFGNGTLQPASVAPSTTDAASHQFIAFAPESAGDQTLPSTAPLLPAAAQQDRLFDAQSKLLPLAGKKANTDFGRDARDDVFDALDRTSDLRRHERAVEHAAGIAPDANHAGWRDAYTSLDRSLRIRASQSDPPRSTSAADRGLDEDLLDDLAIQLSAAKSVRPPSHG